MALRFEDLPRYAVQLSELRDGELLLLKAHMLVERLLAAVLSARLREPDLENVPRLSIQGLIDLTTRADDDRKRFIWFNDLRNTLAHEFDPMDGAAFKKKIELLGMPWPTGTSARHSVLALLSHDILLLAWQRYFDELANQMTLERAPKLSEGGNFALTSGMRIHELREASAASLADLRHSLEQN
jgi:hypothetical protein